MKHSILIASVLAVGLAACHSSKRPEAPLDPQEARAASMGYGTRADSIKPSSENQHLSEENLKAYDPQVEGRILGDYLRQHKETGTW